MSQFGTIGTPRMHPCVSHPSCSQFNARDIMLASAGISRQFRNNPNLIDFEANYKADEEANIIKRSGNVSGKMLEEVQITELQNGRITNRNANKNILEYHDTYNNKKFKENYNISPKQFAEEVNRRYVEVSPGVWTYMD